VTAAHASSAATDENRNDQLLVRILHWTIGRVGNMLASSAMKIRVALLSLLKVALIGTGVSACGGGGGGKLMVDTPVLPYRAPDVDDITGDDFDDVGADDDGSAASTPTAVPAAAITPAKQTGKTSASGTGGGTKPGH
jgi:hypothetical protein